MTFSAVKNKVSLGKALEYLESCSARIVMNGHIVPKLYVCMYARGGNFF